MKKLTLLLVTVVVFTSCKTDYTSDKRISEIDKVLTKLNNDDQFNGTVLIAEKDNIIFEKSYGLANHENKYPFDSASIFNIASISKTFTGVSILILAEKGVLKLDDNLKIYFPEFPYEGITIRNLLTHTSGFQRVQSQPFLKEIEGKNYDNDQIIEIFNKVKLPLYFETGSNYAYSNTNYLFLASIVEKVSGTSFNKFLKDNIFIPAGMKQSFLGEEQVPEDLKHKIIKRYIKPKWLSSDYQNVKTIDRIMKEEKTFENTYGASSIHTTAQDLLKYHRALQNGTLLKPKSLDKFYKGFILDNNKGYTINAASNYPAVSGLTWRVATDSTNGKIVFHSGGIRGGRSFIIRNIEKDQCVIMLTNNEQTNRYNFTVPMKILNGQPFKFDKKSLTRLVAKVYDSEGINSALAIYEKYKDNASYKKMVDFDFEEIGAELIENGDVSAAIQLYKLYTDVYSDEYSWEILGNAYVLKNDNENAKICFEKALQINPKYKSALEALNTLKTID